MKLRGLHDWEVWFAFGLVGGAGSALAAAGSVLVFVTLTAAFLYIPATILGVLEIVIGRELSRRRAQR